MRHSGPVAVEMSEEEFEELVADGLDALPEAMVPVMSNVVVLVDAEPPEDQPGDLLGLYEGTPLTERDSGWESGSLPDRITIFRGPTLRHCDSRQEVAEEVTTTVVHEVAHHFGIDDERLHELGWA